MIHTLNKQSFIGAKYASILSHNSKTAPKVISYQPKQRQENIDHLTEKQKERISILDSKAPQKMYKRFTPQEWIAQHNLTAELDHMGVEFEEVPEEYKNMPNLWKAEQIERIDKARKVIFHGVAKEDWINPSETGIDKLLELWSSITEINSARAYREIQKDRAIKSPIQNWILTKINKSKQIRETKLTSLCFRELDHNSMAITKKALSNSLRALVKNNIIEYEDFGFHRYYKLKNVVVENGEFLKI
jgi:hypothetical protein